ncbi:MAG TPA: hypothetical protein VK034_21260 [Enhygromyxa sp.]|nr:hypothetical protein [Enhygromyxa sp.]
MLAGAPALAEGPEDEAPVDPAPAPVEEAVVVAPAETAAPEVAAAEAPAHVDEYGYPVEDYYVEPAPPVEPYEPEPERRTTLKLGSGYIGFGIAPGMTLHHKGFHPNTRMEMEFGGTLEHRYRDMALSFGVATQVTPYYERKAPSFGADVTMTAILGPVYLRTGLGALGGLPRAHLLHTTTAGIGGVVGVGLTFGREPMVRVGVDYDLRINTKLEPVHTFFLAVRLACCRKD